jgi:hypothetical protein
MAGPAFLVCDSRLPALALPEVSASAPILIEFQPDLTRLRGKLLSGSRTGVEVHAASFLRERRMVLESALLDQTSELRRILIHELFHFVWMRLGNPRRKLWERVLLEEAQARARGELGWSAEWRKEALRSATQRGRRPLWRDYVCESFCDTAAWRYAGIARHDEFTLANRWKSRRSKHFEGLEQRPLAL